MIFTPPAIPVVPPVTVADSRTGAPTYLSNPQGFTLMRWFYAATSSFRRYRGVNVWHMNDGTFLMSDPVDGVPFAGTIGWPYPDTLEPVNNAISSSWFPGGPGGVGGSGPGGSQQLVTPGIAIEYLGGHTYAVTTTEAAALTAVGLGAFVT